MKETLELYNCHCHTVQRRMTVDDCDGRDKIQDKTAPTVSKVVLSLYCKDFSPSTSIHWIRVSMYTVSKHVNSCTTWGERFRAFYDVFYKEFPLWIKRKRKNANRRIIFFSVSFFWQPWKCKSKFEKLSSGFGSLGNQNITWKFNTKADL